MDKQIRDAIEGIKIDTVDGKCYQSVNSKHLEYLNRMEERFRDFDLGKISREEIYESHISGNQSEYGRTIVPVHCPKDSRGR